MPIVRTGVRTKDEILADNVVGVINYQLDVEGKRRSTIINQLSRRYPDASRQSVEAAYNHVIASRTAARAMNRGDTDDAVTRAQTPRNPNLPSQWRYVVEVSWIDPLTRQRMYHTAIVDSPTPLTQGEVNDAAYAQARQRARPQRRQRRSPQTGAFQASDAIYRAIAIERR